MNDHLRKFELTNFNLERMVGAGTPPAMCNTAESCATCLFGTISTLHKPCSECCHNGLNEPGEVCFYWRIKNNTAIIIAENRRYLLDDIRAKELLRIAKTLLKVGTAQATTDAIEALEVLSAYQKEIEVRLKEV